MQVKKHVLKDFFHVHVYTCNYSLDFVYTIIHHYALAVGLLQKIVYPRYNVGSVYSSNSKSTVVITSALGSIVCKFLF